MAGVDETRQDLLAKIDDARRCRENAPPNEACTCEWIIRPLLEAAGYAPWEIVSQLGTPGGGYPDYTVLLNTPHTWYVEAKEWKKDLDKVQDAIQALNYANAHGHRWVVLSNGRQWLLFDNHIQGVGADQRLVARSALEDPDFVDFMLALGKDSIQSGGIEQCAARSRLRSILDRQLADKDSQVIKAVCGVLRNKLGLASVQPPDVATYFRELRAALVPQSEESPTSPVPPHDSVSANDHTSSFRELLSRGMAIRGSCPEAVSFPDGSRVAVRTWVDLAVRVVKWLAGRGKLPGLPFWGLTLGGMEGCRRWFLATSPVYESGKRMECFRLLEIGGGTVSMDASLSSDDVVRRLCALCEAVGEPASGFVVKLKSPIG